MKSFLSHKSILAGSILFILIGFSLWPNVKARYQSPHSNQMKINPADQSKPKSEDLPVTNQSDSSDLRPLSVPELVKLSSRIVVAKCRNVDVQESRNGNIFTFASFDTLQVLKGHISESGFTLRLLGGRVGNVEVDSPITPKFTTGEEIVLFLGRDNTDGYPTIFPQGVFRIRTEHGSGQKIVSPLPSGLTLFSARNNQQLSSSAQTLSLEDFLFSLSKLK